MLRYKTIEKQAVFEHTIEKSRFIGHVKPVFSKEEADAFFAEIRSEHKSATHNVPAFVIGEKSELQWASDDGEPQGTSGAPVVQMMVKEGLTNLAVITTRYFGGVKLGTGGLVRAYTGTAKHAIDAAKICEVHDLLAKEFFMDYTYLGKLQNLSQNGEFEILDIAYTDKIKATLAVEPEKEDALNVLVGNLTGGTATVGEKHIKLVKKT